MVNKFKAESKSVKPQQDMIETLRALMEHIDTSIGALKEDFHLSYERLANEEKLLNKEIDVYDKKLIQWSNNENSNNVKQVKGDMNGAAGLGGSELLKEVIEFDVCFVYIL